MFYTGATLIFDHGHGISTLYMHMDKIFVNVGDHVKKGDIIATVGSTGRSTGPHLDVRLNWFGTRLDPARTLKILYGVKKSLPTREHGLVIVTEFKESSIGSQTIRLNWSVGQLQQRRQSD